MGSLLFQVHRSKLYDSFCSSQCYRYLVLHATRGTFQKVAVSHFLMNSIFLLSLYFTKQNAVHGTMAGFTGFSVGLCNNKICLLPIPELVATSPRQLNAKGRTWERVLAVTRQPNTRAYSRLSFRAVSSN
jgi:hypothetical protein